MRIFVFLAYALFGIISANAGIPYTDWHFWALLFILVFVDIMSATFKSRKDSK